MQLTSKKHSTARAFFLYLLTFTTLYMVAISLGGLLFQLINRALPDVLFANEQYGEFWEPAIRNFLSTLIVAFPIYAYMTIKVHKEQRADNAFRTSGIRKWLTYITLFVAAVTVIIDVITLVNNMLGGEYTTRFLLKVLVVFIIAGGVFWQYLRDIQKNV